MTQLKFYNLKEYKNYNRHFNKRLLTFIKYSQIIMSYQSFVVYRSTRNTWLVM